MGAEKMTNLPSVSVGAIPKDAAADVFVKAMNGSTSTGAFPFQATTSTPNLPSDLKMVSDKLERCGYEAVNLKNEKNGSFSINFKLPDGGAPEIVPYRGNYDPEIENQKVIRFLNASMFTEFPGGDNKLLVVKVANLPPEIENKDVAIAVENGKLVMELNTVLQDFGKIKKFAELPDGVTVSTISTLMEDQTLTLTVTLEKPEPEKKPKSSSKIWRFAKGVLTKAVPACLLMGGKMGFDEMTNDEPNAG